MGTYDPIRSAFDNLNNLMLDSRQWDERQAKAELDNEWRATVLKSDLEQQKFNNRMTERSQILAEKGYEDRHAAHLQALKRSNLDYEVTKETLNFDRKRRPLLIKEHKANLANAELQRKSLDAQLQKDLDDIEELPIQTPYLTQEDMNPDTLNMVNGQLMATRGLRMQIGEDGQAKFFDAEGKEATPPRFMHDDIHRVVVASSIQNDQTENRLLNQMIGLQGRAKELEASIKKANDIGGRDRATIASKKAEYKKLEAEARQIKAQFTDPAKMNRLLENARKLEKAASVMSTEPDNQLYVQSLFESAKRMRQDAQMIQERQIEAAKVAGKKGDNPNFLTENQFIEGVSRGYGSTDSLGKFIADPVNRPKLRTMEGMARSLDAVAGKNPAMRLAIQDNVRNFTEKIQHSYMQQMDKARTANVNDLKKYALVLQSKGLIPKDVNINKIRGRDQLKARVEEGYFNLFQKGVRDFAGDPNLFVYKPNKNMKPPGM